MKRLTAAQQKGHSMRASGRPYRGGYTHEELKTQAETDTAFGRGTYTKTQQVLNKYGRDASVWMVTLRDRDGWEQVVYVIALTKGFAVSVAKARTAFDRPSVHDVTRVLLGELEESEIAFFIGPTGQPQNIAVFDPETGD